MTDPSLIVRRFGALLVGVLSAASNAAAVAEDTVSVTVQELQEELARRDAVIVELLRRVRALEEGRSALLGAPETAAGAGEVVAASPAGPGGELDPSTEGDLEIDELHAERALERGLVQEGARLLAPGQIEVVPTLALTRVHDAFPAVLTPGDATVGEVERSFEVVEQRAEVRAGLPWDLQLEIGLPHLTVDQRTETHVGGAVESVTDESGSGAGDVVIGLSKVLAVEKSWRPNLIGRLAWLTGSGDVRDGAVVLGGGNSGMAARLNAYWRRDPVVFLMSGGYVHYAEDSALVPGERFDLSVGVGLAVSPEAAFIVSLNQSFGGEYEQGGIELPGTDRLASTLDFSISTILGRRLLLRGNTSAGLTEDAPDYRVEVSLSSRFDAL